ncbi:TIGR03118 family protein [Myxococcus stipitatus]|uniref:TIGR03118 family protein n=1 Tax=Myxococcus stipitatus TaxID=83455 RepID=UPI001F3ED794|nr:TIGR03118 family protein [Myxococcus stipitatus]MCE9668099.1 TIGR03118 family protein [Myxococcus stipitatus]
MQTSSSRSLQPRWGEYVLGLSLATAMVFPGVANAQAPGELPNSYTQHNLVSDGAVTADHQDPNLVNPWGLAFNPNGVAWVADNGKGVSTLYDGEGNPQQLVVKIPVPAGVTDTAAPTGLVFSGSDSAFMVTSGAASGPARFIFATEQGLIAAWSPQAAPTDAVTVADRSSANAIYKGLAWANNGSETHLYATDFHNGKIDVFDSKFAPATLSGGFTDPNLPAGFAPFGIQNINGNLYVTYAQQDEEKKDDVKGAGLGYVNVFDANGRFIRRLISKGELNAPWGMALAPASFGRFAGHLLVGNFGDGTIHAYDVVTGKHAGALQDPSGKAVTIDGLWSIAFGNGLQKQPVDALFFTSGPQDEAHGLYGRLEVTPTTSTQLTPLQRP